MNFIEHICEPRKLILCWQNPGEKQRTRFAIAELLRNGDKYSFKYLKDTEDFERAEQLGFTMYPAFRTQQELYTSGVFEAFTRRIPPRNRNDFTEYLQNFRIQEDAKISNFALLGYTGAKLPSDGFSIVDSFENICVPCEFLIELVGTRYITNFDLSVFKVGDFIELIKEPNNQYDPNAIFAMSKGQKIGYINRVQVNAFQNWLACDKLYLSLNIERINGNEERPVIYAFLRLAKKD